ncbi:MULTISPECIES: formyltransferase family protein [Halobacterium]|uniref:formyltetrahydrofolate deformylase n=1 Tax=Halobacterium TaxID=2239 RepID=UPI0019662E56|nr:MULTISPECIES: formyltransferase family protein [Halobacterium]MDL0121903.1 formyltransferase family protein [Halobacterium salinarum]MDL0127725.1 formyltransferase family protein [Halobacterium salinarum]MDL0132661.1 formyltransferase family protein [Halobacterium salinarum]MDL0138353.1 formyltransferase family protein [Halobacterium salinarum]QRY24271.1 ACT domain-containing protein [Halobacterium sp. BOL4-2]
MSSEQHSRSVAENDYTEVTVVGADRTGIVAAVTGLLFEHGANIEDVEQTVRDGVFRMTLLADCGFADGAEPVTDRAAFRAALDDTGDELGVDVRVRFPDERDDGIAVLVTKEDHCLRALLEADLGAPVNVVIGNHDTLEAVADEHDVPFHDIGDDTGTPDEERLLELLAAYDTDLVVLARYMRILSPDVVFRYAGHIVNVHPSLLPAFPGAQAYRQAVEAGVRVAGVTAHYVTTDLDQGPILTQRAFTVPPNASVAAVKDRGQPLEADALVAAVRAHLAGDTTVRRGAVAVDGPHEYGALADD